MKKIARPALALAMLLALPATAIAATPEDNALYNQTQFHDTLHVDGNPEIAFTKQDGSEIDWDNPLTKADPSSIGMVTKFNLDNIDELITKVGNGEISGMPPLYSGIVSQMQGHALVVGSLNLQVDINAGLTSYFTLNQTVLDNYKANPNLVFVANPAYQQTFDVLSITDNTPGVIDILVKVKNGVTGQDLLDLRDNYKTLDVTVQNLLDVNSVMWDDIDNINRGHFGQLAKVEAYDTTYIFNIPPSLLMYASYVGASNPFVGVKLTMDPGYGGINLGFVVAYEDNYSTPATNTAPTDAHNPYNDGTTASILAPGGMTRPGYEFIGWSRDPQDSTNLIQPGQSLTVTNSIVLYAHWQAAGTSPKPPKVISTAVQGARNSN